MNSLPLISHHLFVAAIGNDSREREKPMQHERLSAGTLDQPSVIAVEVTDARGPLPASSARPLRATLTHTGD
jgi:hypothetical protein